MRSASLHSSLARLVGLEVGACLDHVVEILVAQHDRSPSRANKAMVFGWVRCWTQYLVPAWHRSWARDTGAAGGHTVSFNASVLLSRDQAVPIRCSAPRSQCTAVKHVLNSVLPIFSHRLPCGMCYLSLSWPSGLAVSQRRLCGARTIHVIYQLDAISCYFNILAHSPDPAAEVVTVCPARFSQTSERSFA